MPPKDTKLVAQNRKARHDFDILDVFECGIALQGSEVKSLRAAQVQMREAFARVDDGEVWLHGVHIAPYSFATGVGAHDPDRKRKLLLHRREIGELLQRTQQEGLTLVPLSIYFNGRGRAKVELALARGKKVHDKRETVKERDWKREQQRLMRRNA